MNILKYYNICMDLKKEKIVVFDNKLNTNEINFNIKLTDDIILNTKKLIDLTINVIPTSLFSIRPRIMVLIPENISKDILDKIIEIIYYDGKKKFRAVTFIDEKTSIISYFEDFNKCIYIVQLKNGILGFSAFGGQALSKGIMFNFDVPINDMLNQINIETPEKIPNDLKTELKKIGFNSSWNNEKIILSLEPEYYYNKNIKNIENNFISEITYKGLIKYAKKLYSKLF